MDKQESMPLGVVVEWRRIDHPWKDHDWRPVAVIAGAPPMDPRGPWRLLRESEDVRQFHAGTLPLELFRSDTEGYRINLAQTPPRVFVVLRLNADPAVEHEMVPLLLTANPYETQHYVEGGDDVVEGVTMPPEVLAFVVDFTEAHHVEEVFEKRRRKGVKGRDEPFSRRPPITRPLAGDRKD